MLITNIKALWYESGGQHQHEWVKLVSWFIQISHFKALKFSSSLVVVQLSDGSHPLTRVKHKVARFSQLCEQLIWQFPLISLSIIKHLKRWMPSSAGLYFVESFHSNSVVGEQQGQMGTRLGRAIEARRYEFSIEHFVSNQTPTTHVCTSQASCLCVCFSLLGFTQTILATCIDFRLTQVLREVPRTLWVLPSFHFFNSENVISMCLCKQLPTKEPICLSFVWVSCFELTFMI